MNKMIFENVYVLKAYVADDQKQDAGKWVKTGTKSMRINLLCDSVDGDLSTGDVKFVSTINSSKCDVDKVVAELNRFDKLTMSAYVSTFGGKDSYKIFSIVKNGVDLMAKYAIAADAGGNEPFPF